MKLNRLPVLIRTEVTAAAKGANLPAVYSRALVVLEEAVNELSFAKLKQVDISVEGLAAWAKAHQDEQLTKTARELKFRARRTANYIAEQLVKQRKAAFVARGGVLYNTRFIPISEPESGGTVAVLQEAGYTQHEATLIQIVGRASDDKSQLNDNQILSAMRGTGRKKVTLSAVFRTTFSENNAPLYRSSWFRNNSARGIARRLEGEIEIAKAKQIVTLTHAWCDEFLKNLPKTVSKAKVSK